MMTKQELHSKISYVKSFIRMIGYVLLLVNLTLSVLVLLISEGLGVIEELIYEQ